MSQLAESVSRSLCLLCSITAATPICLTHAVRLRKPLNGALFGWPDWCCPDILPAPLDLVLFPRLCLIVWNCSEGCSTFPVCRAGFEGLTPWWCCWGRHNKQFFLLSFVRDEIQQADAKLVVLFVATVCVD